jgi:putative membrane protein
MVLKTSLAFLLVFRVNRCAMRFWEARGLWGNMTQNTRNLVSGILLHSRHSQRNRDMAIRWSAAFCVAAMHFIRGEHHYNPDELHGILTPDQINKMQDADHAPLYAASMIRFYLRKAFKIDSKTLPQLAYAYAIQLNTLEKYVSQLISQVSGMEKI